MIDINLTGVWNTLQGGDAAPDRRRQRRVDHAHQLDRGLKGIAGIAHYTAAKHGVVGLMRTLANELAQHSIRVNTVHPTGVDTPMIQNETTGAVRPADPTRAGERQAARDAQRAAGPVVEPVDISNAVLFLASDEARYVTGVTLPGRRRVHHQVARGRRRSPPHARALRRSEDC